MHLFFRRFTSFLIVYVLILSYAAVVFAITVWKGVRPLSPVEGQLLGFLTLVLPVFLYFCLTEEGIWNATFGKSIMKISVDQSFFLNDQYEFKSPKENSLEWQMHELDGAISYLNLIEADVTANKFKWIHDTIPSFEWGLFEQTIVSAQDYDVIISLNSVTATQLIKD